MMRYVDLFIIIINNYSYNKLGWNGINAEVILVHLNLKMMK